MPVVRHLLQALGGMLVAKGVIDEASSGQLVDLVTTAVGAIISITSTIWMIREKRKGDA
jgi:hypothetical protein